jgi:periplasmic protein TonB
MAAHTDILEHHEGLSKPLLGSVAFHVLVFASFAVYGWYENFGRTPFGSPNAGGGGATTITPVSQINLPNVGGIQNPVANDTESRVPLPPKEAKAKERAPKDDSDAVPIKGKRPPKKDFSSLASSSKYRNKDADRPNQMYSNTGQAMSSQMFGGSSGGGIGVGPGGTIGSQFGWYADLVKEKVQRAWQAPHDPRQHVNMPTIVTFEIQRDGSVRNVRIFQRSGYYDFDMSAQRAVMDAAPFQALPPGYQRNSAQVDLWFGTTK